MRAKRLHGMKMFMFIFRKMVWADTPFAEELADKTFASFVADHGHFASFFDNLSAQVSEEFKRAISLLNGFYWYGLLNATDPWQPVDASCGSPLKVFIKQAHTRRLDSDENADRWFGNVQGREAYKKLKSDEYNEFRLLPWQKT